MTDVAQAGFSVIPFSPLREAIAVRMAEAKRTIPHFLLVVEMEMGALLILRSEQNSAKPDNKVSVTDCLIKACATALMQVPAINIQLKGDQIHQFSHADISVVVAVNGGLLTPIVRQADAKSVVQIATEVDELSTRAKAGRIKQSEISGGTFSISNLGMYGVDQFDAIINSPQCAILAVGRTKPGVLVSSTGEIRSTMVMRSTLSVDHRAIDGVTAAKFLRALRQAVEEPQRLFSN